jgi:hypothetical protein
MRKETKNLTIPLEASDYKYIEEKAIAERRTNASYAREIILEWIKQQKLKEEYE